MQTLKLGSGAFSFGGALTLTKGVGIFDLRINGQSLLVNSQQVRVTANAN